LDDATCPRTCVDGCESDRRMYMCKGNGVVALDGDTWQVVAKVPWEIWVDNRTVTDGLGPKIPNRSNRRLEYLNPLSSILVLGYVGWRFVDFHGWSGGLYRFRSKQS